MHGQSRNALPSQADVSGRIRYYGSFLGTQDIIQMIWIERFSSKASSCRQWGQERNCCKRS
jgi:hypothetical protein